MLRLLLAAPWRRAPLLAARQPAVALAMAVTAGLLGLATASYPLYLASSGSGALAVEVAQRCPDGLDAAVTGTGPVSGVAAATGELESKSTGALVASGAKGSDLQSPVVTLDDDSVGLRVAQKNGAPTVVQLVSRTDGLRNITVLSSVGGGGVWLPNDLAQTVGARAGSEVTLSQSPQARGATAGSPSASVRVAGIYASLVGTVLPRFWCSETSVFGTPDANFPPPPVVLAPQGTLVSLLGSIKASELSSYQWERTLSNGLNVPEVAKIVTAIGRFNRSIGVLPQFLGTPNQYPAIGGGLRGNPAVDNQLVFIVAHAEAVERALRGGILPVSIAGIAIAGLLVAVAGSYWVDRRRFEVLLLSSRGAGPGSLGVKAALENLIPIVVGVLVGWLGALVLVAAIGPSPAIPAASNLDALWSVLAAAALALALVGVVAAMRVRGHAETRLATRRLGWIPFELVGLGTSLWAWSTLGQQSFAAQGTSAPGVSAAFLAFPILFLLSLAVLGSRLTVLLLRSRRFRSSTARLSKPAWLASRRLSGAPRIAALCVGSTAAAVGVLIYASALTSSQDATLHAKAAVFVGSTSSVQLEQPGPLPMSIAPASTEVLSFSDAELNGQAVDVLGVDPATFSRAAFWDRSFASSSLEELLQKIGSGGSSSGPLPVMVAGGGAQGGTASLQLPTYGGFVSPVGVTVVATAHEFPGESSIAPLVVTSFTSLQRLDSQGAEQVWSRDSDQQVLSALARAHEAATIVVTTGNVLDQTTFAAISWTFAYLQALGVLSGAVIVGGLLLFVTTRASQRALAYVLSRRMGLRRFTHWLSLGIELAAMIAPGAVVGGALGWTAVELAQPHLDPLPLLSPPPLLEVPYVTIAAAVGAALLVWAAVSGWAQHAADRSRASELLRADN